MINFVNVGEAAKLIGARSPRDITALFYNGTLRDDLAPLVGGRRLIPLDYLPEIARVLRRIGKLSPEVSRG